MILFLVLIAGVGCDKPIPESGLYEVTSEQGVNTCGPNYDMGDMGATDTEVTVDLENGEVSIDDSLVLQLSDNVATMDEVMFEESIDDEEGTYTLLYKGEWEITWATSTSASGDYGIGIYCEGIDCPTSESIYADELPCESKSILEMEIK